LAPKPLLRSVQSAPAPAGLKKAQIVIARPSALAKTADAVGDSAVTMSLLATRSRVNTISATPAPLEPPTEFEN
jgi:hypothetical protein